METIEIKTKTEIRYDQISNLITCALEGGSNYWYMIEEKIEPIHWDWFKSPSFETNHYIGDYPLNEGGALTISCDTVIKGKSIFILNLTSIEKGLKLMAKNHPQHWNDFISENEDATTGDVFLQLCLFGEIIFG